MGKVNWSNFSRWTLVLLLCLIPVAMALMPMEWLVDDGRTLCLWRNVTDRECYGCGMTRAVVCVVKLRWGEAFEYNRMVVVAFPVLAWLWARWVVRLVRGRSSR